MSFINKEDKDLSKTMSGLPHNPTIWKNEPTRIIAPSNEMRQKPQNPYGKNRMTDNLRVRPSKGPPVQTGGNPNSIRTVFGPPPAPKRRRTEKGTSLTNPGTSRLSRRHSVDKPIDLTEDDVRHSPTLIDDSDDSLNLGAVERSKSRIANDGRATQRLKTEHRGGESSKTAGTDTESESIEEFQAPTKKPVKEKVGVVRDRIKDFESLNGGAPPRLKLDLSNPLKSIPPRKPKPNEKPIRFVPLDATRFTNGSKGKGKDLPALPLTHWVRGTECLTEPRQYFLNFGFEGGKPFLYVTSSVGHQEFRINMRNEAESLEASEFGVSPFIIKFGVRSLQLNLAPESLRQGSNGPRSMVAFQIDVEDEACTQTVRKNIYEFLKDKCGCKGWLSSGNAQRAWDCAVQELNPPATSQRRQQRPPSPMMPNAGHRRGHQNTVSPHPELPPSIELPPPPGGEVLHPPKTSQKVNQMNPKHIVEEQRGTREVVEDEPTAGPSNQPQRRSLRQSTLRSSLSAVEPIHKSPSPSEDPDELLLVYRPLGAGAVNITRGDLERLQPGKYLNDTLIEFGLKLWLNDLRDRDPELADQIHLFSSFFYKKFAIKNKEAGYESVRKWTSRVDVFSKKYLVVPINEHLHWYLAIIYQPEYTLRPAPPQNSPVTRKRKRDEEVSVESAIEASESRETPTTTSKPTSKAPTEIPEGGEIGAVLDSGPPSPGMEVEEQTQTDETTKPEEQEVETQLCAEVSSVSLDENEQDGSGFRKGKRRNSSHVSSVTGEGMEIDDSPLSSPMHVDRDVHIEDIIRESTPQEIAGPSVPGIKDAVPDAPIMDMEDMFDAASIDPQAFYGTAGDHPKTYGRKKPRASAPAKLEAVACEQSGDSGGIVPLKTDHTYIFVFDSLNGKHPRTQKDLAQYLRFEATDKKGVENPTPPEAMAARVPTQDNYCDCGLYLLHFAKVFMEDPAKSFNTILTKRKVSKAEREVDWKKELVGTSRENLTQRIHELGEVWVKERAKEAEEKAKAKEREGTSKPESIAVDSPEDSDDDVIFEEVVTPKPDPRKKPVSRPKPTKKTPRRNSSKTETGPVEAERAPAERFR